MSRFHPLVVTLCALAALSPKAATSSPPLANLSGKVVDKETRQPIFGALVKVEADGHLPQGATTDSKGTFRLSGVAPGTKRLIADLIGYDTYRAEIALAAGANPDIEIALQSDPIQLAPIEIIGESDRVYKKLPGTAIRIDTKALKQIQPVGTQELLELVPGINGYADDGFGNSRLSIGIRGLNPRRSSRVLILEDGVPIQPAVYVYPNAYYNPPAERIDAVEVIKGSSAIRFGPQTMGGVINYTTRRPGQSKGVASQLTAGTNGYYSLFSEWRSLGSRRVKTDLQLLYKHGDGFRDNNTFDQLNSTVKTHFHLSPDKILYLKLNGNLESSNATYTGLTEYSFATDPNFNPKEHDDFSVKRASLDLIYTSRINQNLTGNTTLYFSAFDRRWWREDDIFVRASALDSGDLTPVPYFQSGDLVRLGGGQSNFGILRTFYVGGLEQNYTLKYTLGGRLAQTEIGGRIHWERFVDDKKIGAAPDARDGVYYTGTPDDPQDPVQILGQSHHYETAALALYARQQADWGRLTLNPGLRFEVLEQERVDRLRGSTLADKVSLVVLPGIGANYQFARFNLFAGIHHGYTPPSSGTLKLTNFGQDFADGGLDLKAETSWNIEMGIRSWRPGLTLEVTSFLVKIKDLVAAGRGTAFKNLGKVDNYGLEVGLNLAASRYASPLPDINLTYTYLQTEIKSGEVISATIAGNVPVDLAGNELPYAPRHTLTIGLAKTFGPLRLRGDLRHVDQVYTDFENIERTFNRGDTGPVPGYGIVNASLDYRIDQHWSAFFTAKNLFDKIYIGSRLHSNAGQPQANLSSGILIGPRRQLNLGLRRGL